MVSLASEYNINAVPPCIDARGVTNYLNRPDVRKALHIQDDLGKWEICR